MPRHANQVESILARGALEIHKEAYTTTETAPNGFCRITNSFKKTKIYKEAYTTTETVANGFCRITGSFKKKQNLSKGLYYDRNRTETVCYSPV